MTRNLIGQRFGKLVVIERLEQRAKSGSIRWRCKCDCGGESQPETYNLRCGSSKACGKCRPASNSGFKHGGVGSRTYGSWKAMKDRVKSHPEYAGVSIDPRWNEFAPFLADMGERPAGTTIDRIDGTLGYFKGNCRWATPTQQTRNRRVTRRYTIAGTTKTIAEWAEETGLSYGAAQHRLSTYGALELPHGL